MKSHTEYLYFKTEKRQEFLNITNEVEKVIKKSGIKEGLVLINPMHITAAVYVNDAESGLIQDFQEYFYHPPTAPPSNPAPFNHQWNRVTILIMNLNSLFNFYTDKKL